MSRIRSRYQAILTSDAGMTSAEYAVGTVAACGVGGLLYKIVTSDVMANLFTQVISKAFEWVF